MKYYCNPLNLEYRYQFTCRRGEENSENAVHIFREAADPSLICFKGLYYLFPSMTAGFFTSTDLNQWKFHEFLSDMPVYDYAPDVREIGEYMYFCASKRHENCDYYRTKNPLEEPFEKIEGTFPFWDPDLFLDDDGKLYFYWGCSNVTPIYGVELDRETMRPKTEPLVMFDSNDTVLGYERSGENHNPPKTAEEIEAGIQQMMQRIEAMSDAQKAALGITSDESARKIVSGFMSNRPYIEGAWMTKHEGKYYLQYAIPGTEYNVYNDSVYVSDQPLGPFVPALNNPYSYKPGGFITGAGHGSTLKDQEGRFWHAATMRISHNHSFERRLGLWKAGFDNKGQLYCDQRYGDWPVNMDSPAFEEPEWMLLSYNKKVSASSGTGAENVTDEDIRTWWRGAGPSDGQEWLEVDLGRTYDVRGVQLNFADDGVQAPLPKTEPFIDGYDNRYIDSVRQTTRWLLEGSEDGKNYFILEDKSCAVTDYAHDFLVWPEGRRVRFLKLTVIAVPYGACPCVSGIRVFGPRTGKTPVPVCMTDAKRIGDLDMEVTWKASDDGHNVLWGYAPEALYHSCMVFGKNSCRIGALVKDQPVYVRVDTFNEGGITEGEVFKLPEK